MIGGETCSVTNQHNVINDDSRHHASTAQVIIISQWLKGHRPWGGIVKVLKVGHRNQGSVEEQHDTQELNGCLRRERGKRRRERNSWRGNVKFWKQAKRSTLTTCKCS